MSPDLREVISGCVVALNSPQPSEAGPEYAAARSGMVMMLLALAGQEAERAAAASAWENAAMRDLFGDASGAYDAALSGRLAAAAGQADGDFTLTALDAANADLRRTLIALHEAIEARGDTAWDRRILDLYRRMAQARRLDLAGP